MIVMFRRLLPRIVGFLGGWPAVTAPVITVRHPDRDAAPGQPTAEPLAPIPHAVVASSAESAEPAEPVASVVDGAPQPDVPVRARPQGKPSRRKSGRGTLAEWAMVPRTDLATAIKVLRTTKSVSVAEIAAETGLHQTTIYHVTRGRFASSHNDALVTEGIRAIAARRPAPSDGGLGKTFRMKAGIVRQMRLARNLSVGDVARGLRMRQQLVEMLESGECHNVDSYDAIVRRIQTVWPYRAGDPGNGMSR